MIVGKWPKRFHPGSYRETVDHPVVIPLPEGGWIVNGSILNKHLQIVGIRACHVSQTEASCTSIAVPVDYVDGVFGIGFPRDEPRLLRWLQLDHYSHDSQATSRKPHNLTAGESYFDFFTRIPVHILVIGRFNPHDDASRLLRLTQNVPDKHVLIYVFNASNNAYESLSIPESEFVVPPTKGILSHDGLAVLLYDGVHGYAVIDNPLEL